MRDRICRHLRVPARSVSLPRPAPARNRDLTHCCGATPRCPRAEGRGSERRWQHTRMSLSPATACGHARRACANVQGFEGFERLRRRAPEALQLSQQAGRSQVSQVHLQEICNRHLSPCFPSWSGLGAKRESTAKAKLRNRVRKGFRRFVRPGAKVWGTKVGGETRERLGCGSVGGASASRR